MTETTTTEPALDAHVREYLADAPIPMTPSQAEAGVRDAIASGWHAARADLAETLRDLVEEARADVLKRHPFPMLKRLDALVTELEDGLGR